MLDDSNLGGTLPRYSAKRNLHRALFFCDAPEARQVSLVGDFNPSLLPSVCAASLRHQSSER